jgi:hypothetical protein
MRLDGNIYFIYKPSSRTAFTGTRGQTTISIHYKPSHLFPTVVAQTWITRNERLTHACTTKTNGSQWHL